MSHCSTHCLLNHQDRLSHFSIVPWLHLNLGKDSWAQDLQSRKRVKGSWTCKGLIAHHPVQQKHTSSNVIAHWVTMLPKSCFSSSKDRISSKQTLYSNPVMNLATPVRGAARTSVCLNCSCSTTKPTAFFQTRREP